ncbi:MAG: sigma-54-dependent transcriptional regulator [Guyparkeria sp.]
MSTPAMRSSRQKPGNQDRRFRLLLVEDDEIMGESLCDRFDLEGYDVTWLRRAEGVLETLRTAPSFHVFLSDIRLPDSTGDVLYKHLLGELDAVPPTLFLTGFGSVESAVELLKLGAVDYLTKPFDLDELVEQVGRLCAVQAGRSGPEPVDNASSSTEWPELGVSPAMRRLAELVPRVAGKANGVLITGESGVGKERVARALHEQGGADRPMVAVNCAALPEQLLEAELFGHEKGAFTGATRRRRGVFEQAKGGTLFLDEIGDMPLEMQARLLRVVQERRVTPLGSETSIDVPVQLVCATHQNLRQMVDEGRFREDLYYRINVVHLHVPPLRERREDIPWLAGRLLADIAEKEELPPRELPPVTIDALVQHDWPGNVRELKHCLERAAIFSTSEALKPADLFQMPELAASDGASPEDRLEEDSLGDYMKERERQYITRTLGAHGWRITETAEVLGISRKCLWEKMRRYEIREQP